jgi:hypothetical protein
LAWNGGSDFLLATEGATDQLDASGDGGRTWSSPIADGGDFYGWANLDFVGQYTALVVGPTHYGYPGHPARLDRTDDGGAAWSSVPMPPPRLNQRSMVANLVTAPALGRGHQPDHEPRQLAHTVGPHGPPPDRNVERGHLVHPRRPRPLIAASGPGRSDPSTAGLTPGDIAIMAKEDHATVVGGPRKRQAQAHLDSTLWANADQYRRAETMGIWLQRIRATI